MLIADCVPSFQTLLPLSSTCHRYYELVHEESVSGVVQAESTEALHVRQSCWRRHPVMRFSVTHNLLAVGTGRFKLADRDASFVSHVLTSLRNVPHLELIYVSPGGPHAANLYPLRLFAHLRSLVLMLGSEDTAKLPNLASNLSTALLSLPSLIDLTIVTRISESNNVMLLLGSALRCLASERLQHISLDDVLYEQLIAPEQPLNRRKRGSNQPAVYPNVLSIALNSQSYPCQTMLSHIRSTFPNVEHVALGNIECLDVTDAIAHNQLQSLLDLDSLHVQINELHINPVTTLIEGCRLRCLILEWERSVYTDRRGRLSDMLALTPQLEQLAIMGGPGVYQPSNLDLTTVCSVFDSRNRLPKLTYLQYFGGLLTSDLEYLLSTTSPPAFAATLTHLELLVRWEDRRLACVLLPAVPILYPSLQRCFIALNASNIQPQPSRDAAISEWRAMLGALEDAVGATGASRDVVHGDRLDAVWRREAGLVPVENWLRRDAANAGVLEAFDIEAGGSL